MIGVIFEVWPKPEFKSKYLELAAELKSTLEAIDGFVSVERFQSIYDDNKMLSLSFFETHEALDEWRNIAEHRVAQRVGRSRYFADYRLRVVDVIRDYGMQQREQVPPDSVSALAQKGNSD